MTNAYLNLPGHCFVNELNVNSSNVQEENHNDDQAGLDHQQIDHKLTAHKLNDHPPAYHTGSAQPHSEQTQVEETPDETDSLQLNTAGIQLQPDLLSAFGFTHEHNITLFITQGRIVITTDPKHLAIMSAIEELQLRQDEIKTDFTVAIEALKGAL